MRHVDWAVTSRVEPSAKDAVAVYWAVSPGGTEAGPAISSRVRAGDGGACGTGDCGGGGVGAVGGQSGPDVRRLRSPFELDPIRTMRGGTAQAATETGARTTSSDSVPG